MASPDRTSAMGLWTDADGMRESAKILIASGNRKTFDSTYLLLGHSIEVALKAFLLATGSTLDELKHEFRHDLSKAMEAAVARGDKAVKDVLLPYGGHVELLNTYYKAKEFEYRVTGFKSFPQTSDLVDLLDQLLPVVLPLAERHV